MINYFKFFTLLLIVILNSSLGLANTTCPKSDLLGSRLVSSICWNCIFPIAILGNKINDPNIPQQANDQAFCNCDGNFGISFAYWKPVTVIELVRSSGCLSSFNLKLDLGKELYQGVVNQAIGTKHQASLHYHAYSFPLFEMLGLDNQENSGVEILALSELDPSWYYPELSYLLNPNLKLLTNPNAVHSCVADTIAHLGVSSSDQLAWCVGTWGTLYPLSGIAPAQPSLATTSSLFATRVLFIMQQRGLSKRSYGSDTLCANKVDHNFIKSQYRLQMLYPIAQTTDKNKIGQSSYSWGESFNIPGTGEDAIYLIWQYHDKCLY